MSPDWHCTDVPSDEFAGGSDRRLSQPAIEKIVKHYAADLFDNVQQALNELNEQGQEYQAELGALRQEQKEIDKKHTSTDDRLQDVENFVSEELEKAKTSILDNTNKITALEGLTSKHSQACNFAEILFEKLELKVRTKLAALEEKISDSILKQDEPHAVAYETFETQGINTLYKTSPNELSYLNDRLQSLAIHLNNVQSSVNAIEVANEAREDEVLNLGRNLEDLATRLNNVEMLYLNPNHQSLLGETLDAQQHSKNFHHENAVTISTASLLSEIPELSEPILGYPTVAASQVQRDCEHHGSDIVLKASLFVEEDSDLIKDYMDSSMDLSNHGHESPTREILGLLEYPDMIDPEVESEDVPRPRRFFTSWAVVSTFVAMARRTVVVPMTALISRMSDSNPFWLGGRPYTLDIVCSFLKRFIGNVSRFYFMTHAQPFSQMTWSRSRTGWLCSLCTFFRSIKSSVTSRPSCWHLYTSLLRPARSFLSPLWLLLPCSTFSPLDMGPAIRGSSFWHRFLLILQSAQSFLAIFWSFPLTTFFLSTMSSVMRRSSYWHLYLLIVQLTQSFLALFCKFGNRTWKWHFIWVSFLAAMTYYQIQNWEDTAFQDSYRVMRPRHLRRRFQPT